MPPRSGINASLGVGQESTWGTSVVPTVWLPFTEEDLTLENAYIETAGLRAGRLTQSSDLHVKTTRTVEGSFSLDVLTKNMGRLFNMLHGATVTPTQQAATTAYLQSHPIGATTPDGKSLTVQLGRPDVGGTVNPFTYEGAKVTQVEFSCDQGGVLTAEWSLDAEDENTVTTLTTPTYSSGAKPFNFTQGNIEIDDVVLTECITSANVSVELPMANERFCFGTSGLKREQVVSGGLIEVSATFEAEFASLTQHTAFKNATRRKFELIFTSSEEAGVGFPYSLKFTLPATVTTSAGPTVQGPEILTQTLAVKALDNGTDPALTIDYITTGATL